MLLKKKVKAGILLYALLMLAIFSLLLQFYLNRQQAESQLLQASKQEATAYIMAQMVLEEVEEDLQVIAYSEEQALVEKIDGDQETAKTSTRTSTSSQKEEKKQIDDRGGISFQEGQASYQLSGRKLLVTVELTTGNQYAYQFPVKTMSEGE